MKKEIRKAWESKGRKCVILWLGSHFTAYVETKIKNPDYDKGILGEHDYETSPNGLINVHGGLTFAGKLDITPFDKDIEYFGWDYAHSGDYMAYYDEEPYKSLNMHENKHKWTLEEVEKEVERVVPQIIKYEKKLDEAEDLKKELEIIKDKIRKHFANSEVDGE